MSNVIVTAYVSTDVSGSTITTDYDTDISQEEWDELTEFEQDEILDEWANIHIGNHSSCGAWVKKD